jgi:DNA-binding transcriptional LysR family regulator
MEGFGSLYLSRCVSDFNKIHPLIQIELLTDTRMMHFDRREADVFVSFFRPQGKRILSKKIGEFKISLYGSTKYRDRHGYPNTIKELEQHTFIDFIDDHIYVNENRWLSDILRPKHIIFRSTSLMAQCMSASEGQGIVMLPSFAATFNKDLQPIMPQLFTIRDIWLAVHEDLLHISRIKILLAFLTKRVERDREFLMTIKPTTQIA